MLKKFFVRYFKNSFFNKIFLVYMSIILFAGVILFFVLTQNLITIKYDQANVMSDEIITNVNSYLKSKIASCKTIHQKLYRDKDSWKMLTGKLSSTASDEFQAYQWQDLDKTITQTFYSIDKELNGLIFWGSKEEKTLFFGNSGNSTELSFFKAYSPIYTNLENPEPKLVSSRSSQNHNNAFSLFLFDMVKNPENFASKIGAMAFYFNAMNIQQSYQQYGDYLKGTLYVLDSDGGILYDSSLQYEIPEDFPLSSILEAKDNRFTKPSGIYNMVHTDTYTIVNTFSMADVKNDVKILQKDMLMVFTLVLVLLFFLNYITTHFFSKRIRPILNTMEYVKSGTLTNLPVSKKYEDEIGYIHQELTDMCRVLDNHIQKEYVYRLQQKEMELYTLQAQIDPHFLYNTLESIRMNLYMKGDEEVAKMIYILSTLFRNTMKKDVVTTNREEMDYVKSYLELYQFRLGNRLQFHIQVENQVLKYATIKHILQPIIENALIHGIQETGSESSPCHITIHAVMEGSDILFTVQDDGCGISPTDLVEIRSKLRELQIFHDSIGIYNVNNRLRIVYGEAYCLALESEPGKGTCVTLRIKAMKKKELEAYVRDLNY